MRKIIISLLSLLVLCWTCGTPASSIIFSEDFNGESDPLSYLYQDPGVSHDSFHWNGASDNMGGEARRGRNANGMANGTGERAYMYFSAVGYGDADEYLEYTEDFDFSFDFNISATAPSGNDEWLMLGFWYTSEDAISEHPDIYKWWANNQHFVGAKVKEDGSQVRLYLIHGNGADWVGKAASDDLTGGASLSIGVNYRIEGHYRWDGSTYGQIFGTLTNLDSSVVLGDIPQETITQDEPDIYSVGYNNMNIDANNHRFTKLRTVGVGNQTWGGTQNPGPIFISDNWQIESHDPIVLTSLSVRPPVDAMYLGGTTQLSCEGYDAEETRYDVTWWVDWTSYNPAVVSIDETSLIATGNSMGTTNIQASYGALQSPLAPFEVLPPRVPHDTSYGLDVILQWSELPLLRTDTEAGMASSYFRTFGVGNTTADCNNYDFPTGFQSGDVDPVTIREITGPGLITRTWMPWMPGPEFNLKLYFDGETTPRLDTTTLEWYDTGIPDHPAIEEPLMGKGTGGAYCHTPLYFEDSLKIESNNRAGFNNFYQMNYLLLAPDADVDTYTGTQSSEQLADWKLAAEIINNAGENPGTPGPQLLQFSDSILPGETLVLADMGDEEGVITRLQMKFQDPSNVQLRALMLRVFYDGSEEPAIDVAVSEFFGALRGRIPFRAVSLGTDHEDGYYCYLPMPFREGIRIELKNDSVETVIVTSAEVEYEEKNVTKNYGYLHALHRQEQFAADEDRMYEILSITEGSGHYLGCLLTVIPETTDLNYLEGNDRITIDGGVKETLYGTGLEDAFNGGYYYQENFGGPFSGLLKKTNGITSQYRHRIIDMVPFEESILVEYQGVDIDYWGDQYARLYESTAYWYQKEPSPPELQIVRTSENNYHMTWDEAGIYDLEFDTSIAFDNPQIIDVTGLTEYDLYSDEDFGYLRLKSK